MAGNRQARNASAVGVQAPEPKVPAKATATAFADALLAWFDVHKRALPWRLERTPYRTAVSEVMLQQTQVKTVLPYFARWMEAFPDFAALAAADEAQVLKLWEGLGYYSRVRNLHKLAKVITEQGGLPASYDAWLKLPGIGPYTAAAIASMCHSQAVAVIDGNVIRVLSRVAAYSGEISDAAKARKTLQPLADALLAQDRPGDYNEALMELGATVCHRNRPACLVCPVRLYCRAAASGDPEACPVIAKKRYTQRTVDRAWVMDDAGRLLIAVASRESGRLATLCELPEMAAAGLEVPSGKPAFVGKRGIANERITENIHQVSLPEGWQPTAGLRWMTRADLAEATLSGPHRKWIGQLLERSA